MHYRYDPVGNITRWIDAMQEPSASGGIFQGSVTSERLYTYDAHDRLTSASGRYHQALLPNTGGPQTGVFTPDSLNNFAAFDRYSRSYTYDDGGNLTRIQHTNDDGTPSGWTIDKWVSASSNRQAEKYDDNGVEIPNPEQQFNAAGARTSFSHLADVSYNARGRLAEAVVIDRAGANPNDAEYYVYDAGGRRVRRVTETLVDAANGTTEIVDVRYLDGCEYRSVRQGTTTSLARWTSQISAGEETLATVHRWEVDTQAAETDDISTARIHYLVGDHLGSVSFELDESAQVISFEEYMPYGGTAFVLGNAAREASLREHRFSGKLRDGTTGFYVYHYRYYLPWIGNWLSPDPAGDIDGLNRFAYVRGNPVRFVDELGLRGTTRTGGEPRQLTDLTTGEGTGVWVDRNLEVIPHGTPAARSPDASDPSIIPKVSQDAAEATDNTPPDGSTSPLGLFIEFTNEIDPGEIDLHNEMPEETSDSSTSRDEGDSSQRNSDSVEGTDVDQSTPTQSESTPSRPESTQGQAESATGQAERSPAREPNNHGSSEPGRVRESERPGVPPSDRPESRGTNPDGGRPNLFVEMATAIINGIQSLWHSIAGFFRRNKNTLITVGVIAAGVAAGIAGGPWAIGAYLLGASMAIENEETVDPTALLPPAVGGIVGKSVRGAGEAIKEGVEQGGRRLATETAQSVDDIPTNTGIANSVGRTTEPTMFQDEFSGAPLRSERSIPRHSFKAKPKSVGTTNLRRSATIDGNRFTFNSGHGYDRVHATGDLRGRGISLDEIESAILDDISSHLRSGGRVPVAGPQQSFERVISIRGTEVGYVAVEVRSAATPYYSIPTYYPIR